MAEQRLLIVIPSRGLDAMLAVCVDHLRVALERSAARIVGHVVVVDNASPTPYRVADLPGVDTLLRFDGHRSFSAACNAGAAVADADLLLLLNNDVLLHRDALEFMLDCLADPLVGIVWSRLVFPDGTIQHCGVRYNEGGPFHEFAHLPSRAVAREPRQLQCVTGAALLIRTEAFAAARGLCEDYPFGYEDVDLCLRVRQLGYRISCAQGVDSIHFESLTPGRIDLDTPSRQLFLERWHGRWSVDADRGVVGA